MSGKTPNPRVQAIKHACKRGFPGKHCRIAAASQLSGSAQTANCEAEVQRENMERTK
jgi:hypothetical protein